MIPRKDMGRDGLSGSGRRDIGAPEGPQSHARPRRVDRERGGILDRRRSASTGWDHGTSWRSGWMPVQGRPDGNGRQSLSPPVALCGDLRDGVLYF